MKFEEENISITIPNYGNIFIYFLIKDGIVIYVGQTKHGLIRPLSHKDKEYDTMKIIYCNEDELDILEDKYITKYKPRYNKTLNNSCNYSLNKARNKIRKLFNNYMTITDLKEIIRKLNIEIILINGNRYIKQEDFRKIIDYLKEA